MKTAGLLRADWRSPGAAEAAAIRSTKKIMISVLIRTEIFMPAG